MDMRDAYKIKSSTIDAKKLRMNRRSIDWKRNRLEEVNKGRRIANLSPLQELTNSKSNSQINYEGKTPTKGHTTNDDGKKKIKTQEEYKREYTKWKKEKDLKKKLEKEKKSQKPSFKVSHHVTHSDTNIYSKNAKKGSSTFVPVSSKTKQKIVKPEAQVIKVPAKTPAERSKKPEVSAPARVTGRVTRSQNAAKENIQSKNKPSTRSTRISEKQKICDSAKTSASKKNVNEKKVAGKKKPSNLNLEKVSTSRGISFAPDDFTFSAPSSVSTYEFKPLSPASTAGFLYPATTSFIGTDPKRCSTPKPHSHEEVVDSRVNTVDCVDTSYQWLPKAIPETRRVTRSLRQSILETTTPVTEINKQSDCQSTTKTSEQTDTCVNLNGTPLDMQKEGKAVSKRMTRSLRQSLCMSPPSEALDSPKKAFTPKHKANQVPVLAATDEVESSKSLQDEVFSNSPTKEGNVNQTPERRNTRRTMSNFATFAPPSNDCLVLSASRSKKKRRKTQHDHPVNPKSPEEWVKLLKNSPMVEMDRRPPKTTPLEPLLGLDLDMEFDVDQQTSQPTGDTETATMSLQSTELLNAPSATVNVAVPCQQLTSTLTEDDMAKPEDSNVEMAEPTVSTQESLEKYNEVPSKPDEHDVEYFRNLMATETNTFNGYCSKWEDVSKVTPELDEEVEGQIRTCIGQAQLLIAQRFKQFKGLVDNCEFGTGEKETTLTDLQGFWDMIYYQVEDVHTKFTGLEKLKDNNWVQDKPKVTKKVVKQKTVVKPAVKRPAVASKFAAFRAQMKKKQAAPDILCQEEQAITFDGGFFKVASPKKTPKFHCEAGSPQRKASVSSAEKEKASKTTEKEKVTEPKKTPLMEVLSPAVDSLGLTSLRTPSRKSYVPVNPSPLLRDITPQVNSKGRPTPHSKRMCTGVETETSLNNKENDTDDVFTNDNAVKTIPSVKCVTGTPKSKVTPRRSLRTRRSLCDMSSPSTAKKSESDNDFFKYLQPSSTAVLQATNNISALDDECDDWDLSTAFSATDYVKKDSPAVSRRRSSSLKQLRSTQRRRSTRRSVHFSASPTIEHTPELENVMDVPGAVSEDILLFTPPGHKSSIQLHDYVSNSMNAGATPACRKARPSLLYTPPENTSALTSSTAHTEIPTDTLISFTP